MIALQAGGYEVDLKPEVGGSVSRFTFEGIPILRPTKPDAAGPREHGCYPLAAYANRIAFGQLKFGGKEYHLPKNAGDHPHPMHGHGWQAAWQTVSSTQTSAVVAFEHQADSWPWPYRAEQTYTLSEKGLRIRLGVRNLAAEAMPVCLGLHPYFPRTPNTILRAQVSGVWLADDTMIPTVHESGAHFFDLDAGARLGDAPFVDNCFSDWHGHAVIEQPDFDMAVTMDASKECGFFHTAIFPGNDFFAAEPVSAMPNSFNRSEPPSITGARALAPNESFAIEMRLKAERR
jgi:aldose 1-epimerase